MGVIGELDVALYIIAWKEKPKVKHTYSSTKPSIDLPHTCPHNPPPHHPPHTHTRTCPHSQAVLPQIQRSVAHAAGLRERTRPHRTAAWPGSGACMGHT